MHVVVVGAGFAGAITARVVCAQGHEVTLIDRGRHPRFALGESSTPLAAIVLERLARRYGLTDLHELAAYGRWQAHLPELRCGLKRGFTFYRHHRGERFSGDATNTDRLLVAASPDDAAADTHWYRQDVDDFLVRRAQDEGVRYVDETELAAVETDEDRFVLTATRLGRALNLNADFLIDASGSAGAVAKRLGATEQPVDRFRTGLVYGHFEGVKPLVSTLTTDTSVPKGPFADEHAAVHHLIDEGWMYELRFDNGVLSAGFVIEYDKYDERDRHGDDGTAASSPEKLSADRQPSVVFNELLASYPTLAEQFEHARPLRPIATIPILQRRLSRAAGHRWVALPHTYMFWSPLFSTGIAWSLLSVERIGLTLERGTTNARLTTPVQRYADTLTAEGDHLRQLIEGAYSCRHEFDAFEAFAQVYFTAASYCETIQRLCSPPDGLEDEWAWFGFLGATDPVLAKIVNTTGRLILSDSTSSRLDTVRRLISPRNLAGLADPKRRRLYAFDLEAVVAAAEVLGLSPDEVRSRLPRLRAALPRTR